MNKNIKKYISADEKGRKLWKKSKLESNPKRREKLMNESKRAFAEKNAIGLMLQAPKTSVVKKNFKISNCLNRKISKKKKFSIFAKFSWLKN